jgi:hypothetical protein
MAEKEDNTVGDVEFYIACPHGCTGACPAYTMAKKGETGQYINTMNLFGCQDDERHKKCGVYKLIERDKEIRVQPIYGPNLR